MRGYPKYVNCKQDFNNLLADKDLKGRTLAELQKIYTKDDSKALRATTLIDPEDPKSDWNTEEIDNPMPLWKQKGFESRKAVATLITKNGGKI